MALVTRTSHVLWAGVPPPWLARRAPWRDATPISRPTLRSNPWLLMPCWRPWGRRPSSEPQKPHHTPQNRKSTRKFGPPVGPKIQALVVVPEACQDSYVRFRYLLACTRSPMLSFRDTGGDNHKRPWAREGCGHFSARNPGAIVSAALGQGVYASLLGLRALPGQPCKGGGLFSGVAAKGSIVSPWMRQGCLSGLHRASVRWRRNPVCIVRSLRSPHLALPLVTMALGKTSLLNLLKKTRRK